MKQYCVYIVQCADNSYYTGVTNNVERRLIEHNSGLNISCYTYTRKPVKLVWMEIFNDINQAIAVEKQIRVGVEKRNWL